MKKSVKSLCSSRKPTVSTNLRQFFNAASLRPVICFCNDGNWMHEKNGLFIAPDGRLFLAEANENDGSLAMDDMTLDNIKDAWILHFNEVTVKEALAWFCRCFPWCQTTVGSLTPVLELAVKQLKD